MIKAQDKIECPQCGEKSFAKKQSVMDDEWNKTGEILVCAFCGHKLADCIEESSNQHATKNSVKTAALAELLGDVKVEQPVIEFEGTAAFCRDCRFFIAHPFLSHCTKHDKSVNPMDDCNDFQSRQSETES